jgi:hypothetical protein
MLLYAVVFVVAVVAVVVVVVVVVVAVVNAMLLLYVHAYKNNQIKDPKLGSSPQLVVDSLSTISKSLSITKGNTGREFG